MAERSSRVTVSSAIPSLRRCDDSSDKKPRLNSGLVPRECRTYCNRRRIPRANARCAWSCRSIRDTNCLDGDEHTYEIVIPSAGQDRVVASHIGIPLQAARSRYRAKAHCSAPWPGCITRLVDGDGYWAGLSDCARCPRHRQGDLGPGRWGHGGV